MQEPNLCELIAKDDKEQKKVVLREKRARFAGIEEKVAYLVEQNYRPSGFYYGDLDPVESCLIDAFTSEKIIRVARIQANSSDDAIKKTILFDVLVELTGAADQKCDVSKMSMKKFSQYFALNLIYSSMKQIVENPEEKAENLFEKLASGKHRSQLKDDDFYEFRRPNPVCELVATKYISLFRYKGIKEKALNATCMHDLRYILVADIYAFGLNSEAQQKAMSYLEQGEYKKAAVYAVLQSIKDELFL